MDTKKLPSPKGTLLLAKSGNANKMYNEARRRRHVTIDKMSALTGHLDYPEHFFKCYRFFKVAGAKLTRMEN